MCVDLWRLVEVATLSAVVGGILELDVQSHVQLELVLQHLQATVAHRFHVDVLDDVVHGVEVPEELRQRAEPLGLEFVSRVALPLVAVHTRLGDALPAHVRFELVLVVAAALRLQVQEVIQFRAQVDVLDAQPLTLGDLYRSLCKLVDCRVVGVCVDHRRHNVHPRKGDILLRDVARLPDRGNGRRAQRLVAVACVAVLALVVHVDVALGLAQQRLLQHRLLVAQCVVAEAQAHVRHKRLVRVVPLRLVLELEPLSQPLLLLRTPEAAGQRAVPCNLCHVHGTKLVDLRGGAVLLDARPCGVVVVQGVLRPQAHPHPSLLVLEEGVVGVGRVAQAVRREGRQDDAGLADVEQVLEDGGAFHRQPVVDAGGEHEAHDQLVDLPRLSAVRAERVCVQAVAAAQVIQLHDVRPHVVVEVQVRRVLLPRPLRGWSVPRQFAASRGLVCDDVERPDFGQQRCQVLILLASRVQRRLPQREEDVVELLLCGRDVREAHAERCDARDLDDPAVPLVAAQAVRGDPLRKRLPLVLRAPEDGQLELGCHTLCHELHVVLLQNGAHEVVVERPVTLEIQLQQLGGALATLVVLFREDVKAVETLL
eukprot:Rhum_TRINITY_DN8055_c0_g1::Rhum_TRINITY_DN8055_c0_g1_i1::g.25947::m.25947